MNRVKVFKSFFGSVLVALLLLYFLENASEQPKDAFPVLKVLPSSQDVYVLGNSMFGVGFDINLARSLLPDKTIDFAYYNGHYTSMWHLAADVGMERSTAPQTMVWGFRPTYAVYPAFRQNRETDEEFFRAHMNSVHREILSRAGDPAYHGNNLSADQKNQINAQSVGVEIFQNWGSKIVRNFERYFEVLSQKSVVLSDLVEACTRAILGISSVFSIPEKLIDSDGKIKPLNDLLIEYTSNGKVKVADALVVDNGNRFIKGDAVNFEDSFVPEIASEIFELGSEQLIVIFRPVSTFEQPLDTETQQFYEDSVSYTQANNLLILDLMVAEGLQREMYADGDHLNESGRKYVTELIVQKLRITEE